MKDTSNRFLPSFLLVTIILLLSSKTKCNKEVEQCLIETISYSDPTYRFVQSLINLKKVLSNYDLMPDFIMERLKMCTVTISDEKRKCEHKYGFEKCEECGMLIVPVCPIGFVRIDCSTCARRCPPSTEVYADGLLCAKPKIMKKRIYRDYQLCFQNHDSCNKKTETLIISNCLEGWEDLGDFLCTFKCPEGFKNDEFYCAPELIENYDFTYDEMADTLD